MLEKLNPRERLLILGLVGLVGVGALLFIGAKIAEQRETIKERVTGRADDVKKMKRLRDDIRSMPMAAVLPDKDEFAAKVATILDRMKLQSQSARTHIETPSPKEEALVLELTFSGISLKDAIGFLHTIEYSKEVPARVGALEFRKPLAGREIYDMRISLVITRPKR